MDELFLIRELETDVLECDVQFYPRAEKHAVLKQSTRQAFNLIISEVAVVQFRNQAPAFIRHCYV